MRTIKLSKLIKELQEAEKEHGGDIEVEVYMYKEMSPIRYIGVSPVFTSWENGKEVSTSILLIEGNKFTNL